MSNGDERMEEEGMDAYELGRLDGKVQQPRAELTFSEPHDNEFYNKGWYAGYEESIKLTATPHHPENMTMNATERAKIRILKADMPTTGNQLTNHDAITQKHTMKKFTIVCLSIDPPAEECFTHLMHVEAEEKTQAVEECKENHPYCTIITILPGWHDPA